jgi:hypothetical protein
MAHKLTSPDLAESRSEWIGARGRIFANEAGMSLVFCMIDFTGPRPIPNLTEADAKRRAEVAEQETSFASAAQTFRIPDAGAP